jgi:hypothetical protein
MKRAPICDPRLLVDVFKRNFFSYYKVYLFIYLFIYFIEYRAFFDATASASAVASVASPSVRLGLGEAISASPSTPSLLVASASKAPSLGLGESEDEGNSPKVLLLIYYIMTLYFQANCECSLSIDVRARCELYPIDWPLEHRKNSLEDFRKCPVRYETAIFQIENSRFLFSRSKNGFPFLLNEWKDEKGLIYPAFFESRWDAYQTMCLYQQQQEDDPFDNV